MPNDHKLYIFIKGTDPIMGFLFTLQIGSMASGEYIK